MNKNKKTAKPRIIVIPHYVGTEKADVILEKIIAEEIKKKNRKICLNILEKMGQPWYN